MVLIVFVLQRLPILFIPMNNIVVIILDIYKAKNIRLSEMFMSIMIMGKLSSLNVSLLIFLLRFVSITRKSMKRMKNTLAKNTWHTNNSMMVSGTY